MNWAWAASLDPFWRSPNLFMWLVLAAAGLFGIVTLVALLRAEKSVGNATMPEHQLLRRAVERDRYGLMAYVLVARDRCTPSDCAAFQALADRHHIMANMDEKIYEGLISRYAPSWNTPAAPATAGPVA